MVRVHRLLLVIATLLPISWTARINTESFLAIGKDNAAQQTSDALQDQADRYHALLVNQERVLAEYEADKICAINDLTFKEEELKKKDKWYKIHKWEIWSNEKPNLRKAIETLKQKVAKTEELIVKAKEELNRLQESKKKTATAQSLVDDHQATIQNLQDQIGIKQQERKLTEDQHLEDLTAAQALANENMRLSEKRILAISQKIAKHDDELQLLAAEHHDVQQANKKAQGVLEDAIADYEVQIKDLDGQIFVNQQKVEELVKDKNEAQTKYDASIQQLENDRFGLITQRNALQKQMKSASDNLNKITQEANAQIASLQSELEGERDQLQKDLAQAQANLQNERIEHETNLAMLKNKHSAEIAHMKAELKSLQDSVASSSGAVKALSMEVADSVALSATVQMAVADLRAQKKVQEDAKADALRDIQNAQASRHAKSYELHSASSWYKFWYWNVWSDHKKSLENDIAFLQGKIDADNSRKDKHQTQMESLQNQINEAVSSLSNQGALQAEKAKLKGEIQQNILEMNAQITAQKAQRDATEANQQDAMKREEEKNSAEIAQFQDMVAKLEAEKQQTVKALEAIQDNKHDQQQALQVVQDNLRAIIAGYHNSIGQLSDSIQLASKEIEREQKARDDDLQDQDDVIDGLRTHETTMGESREAAANSKVNEEGRLEALKQAHEDDEKTLTDTVMASRQELEQTKNKHTTNYEAERSGYAKELEEIKNNHDKYINEIDAEIEQLKVTKTETQGYVQDITEKAVK